MAIADNFDRDADAGFIRSFDPRAARRQLHVSVALVLALALAALALGALAWFGWPAAPAYPVWVKTSGAHIPEMALDIRR